MANFVKENILAVIIVTVFFLFSYIYSYSNLLTFDPTLYNQDTHLIFWFSVVFVLFVYLFQLIINFKHGYRGIKTSTSYIFKNYMRIDRLISLAVTITIVPIFFSSYTTFKIINNHTTPFYFDLLFQEIDYLLHFGNHPWELLFPLFQSEQVTVYLDWIYCQGWFAAWISVFVWMAWTTDRPTRWVFFSPFKSSWIFLGVFMACLLSSAGPCYFDKVTGDFGPYHNLMTHLQKTNETSPLFSIRGQEIIWGHYLAGPVTKGGGISAMPSMHISMMTLCTLGVWTRNRALGYFYTLLTILFVAGSVFLGWHYAVDGYVSIILTCLLWHLFYKLSKKKFKTEASQFETIPL